MTLALPVLIDRKWGGAELTPRRQHLEDAGLDLISAQTFALRPGETRVVETGIFIAIPDGQAGLILPRSGLAASENITVVNAPGLIDAGYRGPVKVILHKLVGLDEPGDPNAAHNITAGDRIAQLLIVPLTYCLPTLVWSLPVAGDSRGDGGLGSTGR